ncbi:DCN1-like protein 4 isoform X1 [Cinnamomum micranthum f. kanehirae]|uniref:Defective in cullin neddylation protein n=1 Tax=Cinnamomum micranthum f. kanehirae TaxID=337451 RepID=A0A443PJZ9_9MAGN|nr:DCN1-like protein 4 isoform X1 [Cinnamomum micranthum f. kanehirae]
MEESRTLKGLKPYFRLLSPRSRNAERGKGREEERKKEKKRNKEKKKKEEGDDCCWTAMAAAVLLVLLDGDDCCSWTATAAAAGAWCCCWTAMVMVVVSARGCSSPEGIEQLCSDVEVDHTDVRILMLAWKMKAEKQGYFTLEEWRRGLKALRADTIGKLKKALSELEKEVSKPPNFLDFYSYAFRYCLTEEKQKSIDIESICELLVIVLGSQYIPQVTSFVAYLKTQNDYKVINMDQWMGFLRFCQEANFPSLDNYDPDEAWPLILDNYVEWIREKRSLCQRRTVPKLLWNST